jgi:hypothetical protein
VGCAAWGDAAGAWVGCAAAGACVGCAAGGAWVDCADGVVDPQAASTILTMIASDRTRNVQRVLMPEYVFI